MSPAWLLPEYVEDILPPFARQAEALRRRLLDLFDGYGYDLVYPPLVEYLDSLLTGAARDLDLKTFKVVDGLSGRMMGVRADMTPQAARIDAHLINRDGVTRLCYAGPVLRTKPAGFLASREPFQLGAELFGHAGIEADLEIQQLLIEALDLAGVPGARLSLGHAGLFRALADGAQLDEARAAALFAALRGKDVPEVEALSADLAAPWREAFRQLPGLYGDASALEQARALLPKQAAITQALDELTRLLAAGNARGNVSVAVDLSDLRGDGYHNGATFAAYAGGQASAVALGGRYDGAGSVFGRSRPATGFSLDLRQILDCLAEPGARGGILAPCLDDAALRAKVIELRNAGERVVVELPGQVAHRQASGCDRILVQAGQDWIVQ
ncbi:MAG: ATP phosphoribosyltransferase regulatory subunit [Hydrogenophilales bacterium 28-61-23]|nr:MAG: ATP phosphoribosyltransferase regulatory subunit [Hydrogenophilales bacterium 28-61-23]